MDSFTYSVCNVLKPRISEICICEISVCEIRVLEILAMEGVNVPSWSEEVIIFEAYLIIN